ncbi:RNA-directed DNA polymerase (Reverse transcriptase), Ribonuclease H-like protein [Gossypium australe]|uniref:RNA-directed DNA polymerase (Reverse transcriptase), Ribonuclease H-like protein n=1 Tax=Gossypium australe TaxID=47621 RepID=A0A5B6WXQ6_9ROSI|nr:RNA-directed DNA polymerase (Reverse transcriptase), Ribonuclease H-like protein [Gossypium australe]
MAPLKPPYPKWYDPNASCMYHAGNQGHFTENCIAFKRRVQGLINAGILRFDDTGNMAGNPLPNHAEGNVSAVMKEDAQRVKRHDIQSCEEFRKLLQDMINNKEIKIFDKMDEAEEKEICASDNQPSAIPYSADRPLVIYYEAKKKEVKPTLVIKVPSSFPYKDDKAVPWKYDANIVAPESEKPKAVIGDISRVGHFTRSGSSSSTVKHRGTVEQIAGENLGVIFTVELEATSECLAKSVKSSLRGSNVSIEKLDRWVKNLNADNFISFSDDEIPLNGRGSVKALHIMTNCKGYIVPDVLIDNGSALNVMFLATLSKMPVDMSYLRPCHSIVRAFDGTRQEVMGKIEIPLEVGPCTYDIGFQVMDITPSYNCLLGRPWIHSAGAVPSSLHQKVKFVMDNRLITVAGEEDIVASISIDAPYIDINKDAVECSFRCFEFINATFVVEGNKIPTPKLSRNTKMGIKLTVGKGARAEKGLGKYQQGIVRALKPVHHKARYGMMYPGKDSLRSMLLSIERGLQNVSINVMDKEDDAIEDVLMIRYCPSRFTLNNWTAVDLLVVFKSSLECSDVNDVNNPVTNPKIDFEKAICLGECEAEKDAEDYVSSPELLRIIKQEDQQILPHQESVETVNLGNKEKRQEVKIGTSISENTKHDLIALLQEYKDLFAWSYQDMPGLNEDVVVHRLPLKPRCKPIQQKLRRMRPEMLLKIKEEVKKQFDAGFLQVSKYPEWVANIVPVPKKDGKIKMAPEDMEKTTFITMWGTFCYKVMPFGLKNDGATYQRAMVMLFHDMMHKEIEVYVDDMIVKSRGEREHVGNLRKLFERLRKFQLKLNPAKCTFRATLGKLLGFIVSERGIEVDPDKIKAIQELPPPRTQKEVRGFLGRLNYIARFIAQLTNQCDPIFRLLLKHNPGEWSEECQVAFDKIKQYLSDPPVLVLPTPRRPLILYLTVFENSIGCVLGQHDESGKRERAIYYLSKKFTDYEAKYPSIEKFSCVLILLSEYDIIYVNQKLIKGSAIADFLATRTTEEYEPLRFDFPDEDLMYITEKECESSKEKSWKMSFDSASNTLGHGIGTVLMSPEGNHYPFTARLNFFCTNNVAEYEACIMGTCAAIERDIEILKMSIYEVPAHCFSIEKEADIQPWFHDILEYVKNQKGRDQVLLRCVDAVEARKILEDAHEGVCGTHANGFTMARQIMRLGYYWLTMESDCGMDVIGPISPKASNGHQFIFVVIDYFTKWVETASFANVTKAAVCRFLKREIICRYGLPERIILDNALNLNNKMMKEVCEQFQIKHHNSSPYRPKINGAVEAANKNIKRIIGKMTEIYKDWYEKLPFALYAYRTCVRTSTGATPFSLVYGMEAVLPIEVEIPSLLVLRETKLEESEWVQARYDQLNLIEEKRLKAICHGQIFFKICPGSLFDFRFGPSIAARFERRGY